MSIYLMERRFLGIGLLGTIALVVTIQAIILAVMAREGHIADDTVFHFYLNGVLIIIWLLILKGDFKIGISKGVDYRRQRIDDDLPGSVHILFSVRVDEAREHEQYLHRLFRWWSFVPAGAGEDAGKTEWFKFNIFIALIASCFILYFAYQGVINMGIFSLLSIVILINYI